MRTRASRARAEQKGRRAVAGWHQREVMWKGGWCRGRGVGGRYIVVVSEMGGLEEGVGERGYEGWGGGEKSPGDGWCQEGEGGRESGRWGGGWGLRWAWRGVGGMVSLKRRVVGGQESRDVSARV